MSSSEDNLNALATLIFNKSGLSASLNTIADGVENKLAENYAPTDNGEDDLSNPSYGGVCYTTYNLINEGKILSRIDRTLTDTQRELLKRIVEDGNLTLSVCRNDGLQHEYSFHLSIPHSPTVDSTDRISIRVDIEFSVNNTRDVALSASTDDEVDDTEVSKVLMLYTLAY